MTDVFDIVAEQTGLDIRDSKLTENVIAPAVGSRIGEIFGDIQKGIDLASRVFSQLMGLSLMSTPALIFNAVDAISGLVDWLSARISEAEILNVERKINTRDAFVKENYREGAWSQIVPVYGPSPADLDRTDNRGGKTAEEHLAQYRPKHIVWHALRVTRRPALRPTWPWNPDPVSPDRSIAADVPNVIAKGDRLRPSVLGGFRLTTAVIESAVGSCLPGVVPVAKWTPQGIDFVDGRYCFRNYRPAIPPMPESDADKYWCDPPSGGFGAASLPGCGIPPGYEYLFSWGTYPFIGWNGIELSLGPYGVSMCLGLVGLTPVHAAVAASEVETCYRHWLEASKLRELPALTVGQHDPWHIALDEQGLPWSPTMNRPWPSAQRLTVRDVRHIEQSFRDFFAIRRSALYMYEFTSASFKAAAEKSRDPTLRAVATGAPPPKQQEWRKWDPLGDDWRPSSAPPTGPGGIRVPKKSPKGPGDITNGPSSSGGGAGLVVGLAALAGIGVLAATRRKR